MHRPVPAVSTGLSAAVALAVFVSAVPAEAAAPEPTVASEAGASGSVEVAPETSPASPDAPTGDEVTAPGDATTPPSATPTPAAPAVDPDLLEAGPEADRPRPAETPADLPPARPSKQGPVSPPPASGVAVQIDVTGAGEVELFRLDPGASEADRVGTYDGYPYVRVCVAPCEERVRARAGDVFFVAGREVIPSRPFDLDLYDQAELTVRPGPKKLRMAGFGLTVGGAVMVPAGILLGAGVAPGDGPRIAGYTVIGVGLAAIVAGVALIIRGRTKVEVDGRTTGPRSVALVRF